MAIRGDVRKAVAALAAHRKKGGVSSLRNAFARDQKRFANLSAKTGNLLLDYSKCAVNARTMQLLLGLARAADVAGKRDAMFAGRRINTTEGRPVLHTALRNRSNTPVLVDGRDVMPDVNAVLDAMARFAREVRAGRITDVVNIGIGGSDLGPAMATLALAPYRDGPRLHFVSNVDSAHIADTLKTLNAATTLFLIASKSFTTIETMTNAHTARNWIAARLGEAAVSCHFAAISTATARVKAFGIDDSRIFGFWDWVGGRYSIWSAIGLPLMIAIGPDNFGRFLDGGNAMDKHFTMAPVLENLPMLMGLLGVWHRNVCRYPSRAVIPYDQRLSRFPAFLQQLDMESNGKHVGKDGSVARMATGPVVWGEPGTNGQHAFFQLLHQGSDIIPVEFLIAAEPHEAGMAGHHNLLIANCLAQSRALMLGRTLKEAEALSGSMELAPHRVFVGNRPSLTIAYKILDPETLGSLVALYEHRVFVEAAIWDINAFDQWGVELGKELATGLLPVVEGEKGDEGLDSSTAGLAAHLRKP
jgi:glucose-6-phosphate isomerase